MMQYYSGSFWPLFGLHVHFLFGALLFVGGVLFVIWAVKYLKEGPLKNWALWLVVLGILGVLLTSGFGLAGFFGGYGSGMMTGGRFGGFGPGMMMGGYGKFSDQNNYKEWRDEMIEQMDENMGFDEEAEVENQN